MKPVDLGAIVLDKGTHDGPDDGMCLLEAVAWIAGEPWADRPKCVSAVLASFGLILNDALLHEPRQRLTPLIPTLIGTRDDGLDETRGYLALDWLVRTWTPAWLEVAGLSAQAAALRDLRPIVDPSAVEAAGPVVFAGREKARAINAAAGDAARAVDGEGARYAAGVVAWADARQAGGDAAWYAVRSAGRAVAQVAGSAVAWVAVGDDARNAARYAAWDAPNAALATAATSLQESAIDLFTRMIRPGGDA